MDREKLLKSVIGVRVHAGPSVAVRELDVADMLKEAGTAGYRGFLVKDHYSPNMIGYQMVQRHLGSGSVEVFGSMCLNNVMGLFNLNAVGAAYGMGVKMTYFPTVSSKNHVDAYKSHFAGAGKMSIPETPVVYVDENGRLDPAAVWILEYVSERDMALGTGHGSAREVDTLVRKAMGVDMEKILVNRPHFHISVTYERIHQWIALDVYIELNACVSSGGSKMGPLPTIILEEILREMPYDRIMLDSDMGQKGNGSPVETLYNFMCPMMERFRITEGELEIMVKKSPAILMGLE